MRELMDISRVGLVLAVLAGCNVPGPTDGFDASNEDDGDGSDGTAAVTATAIGAGVFHMCAVVSDTTARCWGNNDDGQLGGTPGLDGIAVVTGLSAASTISGGTTQSCAVKTDGTLQCWGGNSLGELGSGTTTPSSIPVTVSGISSATAVAAGGLHTCAVHAGGTASCWGTSSMGELGNGVVTGPDICTTGGVDHPCSMTPVTVTGISSATAISAGENHTCALGGDGTVNCWGSGTFGQLGDGLAECFEGGTYVPCDATTPVVALDISTATAIAAGDFHTCAVLADGTVQCWGNKSSGQVGDGTSAPSSIPLTTLVPIAVTAISTASAIAAGREHTCALMREGTVQCWGSNYFGQLGTGSDDGPETCGSGPCSTTPVEVSGISTATAITAGGDLSCALLTDGRVMCWGKYAAGIDDSASPVEITGF